MRRQCGGVDLGGDRPWLAGRRFLATAIPRLCARTAACRRRRSHRDHRQCGPQADAGGQTSGLGRPVLLAGVTHFRSLSRSPRLRQPRLRCKAALSIPNRSAALIGTGASGLLPARHRRDQSRHPGGGVCRVSSWRGVVSRLPSRNSIACSPAAAFLARIFRAVVPAWCRAAGRCSRSAFCLAWDSIPQPRSACFTVRREPGVGRHDVRNDHDLPGFVHRWDDGWSTPPTAVVLMVGRLRLGRSSIRSARFGTTSPSPQFRFSVAAADRRHRGVGPDRRQTGAKRRLSGT